jgi:hypothetical protein
VKAWLTTIKRKSPAYKTIYKTTMNKTHLNLQQGLSQRQLKALLKYHHYKVPRDWHRRDYVAQKGNRLYRFRWWTQEGFLVDVSEPLLSFDRWANSTYQTLSWRDFQKQYLKKAKPQRVLSSINTTTPKES